MNRRRLLRSAAIGLPALRTGWDVVPRADASEGPGAKKARRGVTLAGAEFGVDPKTFSNENLGAFGKAYTYNSEKTVAYFADHGVTLIRLPFRWERLQPRLGEDFDKDELGRIREFVGWAKRHGATVILDPHNYGRYSVRLGGKATEVVIDQKVGGEIPVTRRHFADLWRRLSDAFKGEPAVEAYALMNEPHDMGGSDWKAISQAAVDAIRADGDRKTVIVPGDSWSSAKRWVDANGTAAWINDPDGNLAYEAHSYWDGDESGTYARSYDDELARDKGLEYRGVRHLIAFAGWCATNDVNVFVGEFGVPADDPRWLKMLARFVGALDRAGIESCYWAAGEWWGSYKLSLQPRDDFRTPATQMKELVP
jgi:endoglucanase